MNISQLEPGSDSDDNISAADRWTIIIAFIINNAIKFIALIILALCILADLGELLRALAQAVIAVVFWFVYPYAWKVGQKIRLWLHPQAIIASGAAGLFRAKIFWLFGPQTICAFWCATFFVVLSGALVNQSSENITPVVSRAATATGGATSAASMNGNAYLGVIIQNVGNDNAESLGLKPDQGALITYVRPGGPGAVGGLQSGDIVLQVNGHTVTSNSDMARQVDQYPIGDTLHLQVLRDNRHVSIDVKSGLRPSETQQAMSASGGDRADDVQSALDQQRAPSPAVLGMNLASLSDADRQRFNLGNTVHGVVIESLADDSELSPTGLHAGDVIARAGDRAAVTPGNVASAVADARKSGRKGVFLLVTHENRNVGLTVKFDKGEPQNGVAGEQKNSGSPTNQSEERALRAAEPSSPVSHAHACTPQKGIWLFDGRIYRGIKMTKGCYTKAEAKTACQAEFGSGTKQASWDDITSKLTDRDELMSFTLDFRFDPLNSAWLSEHQDGKGGDAIVYGRDDWLPKDIIVIDSFKKTFVLSNMDGDVLPSFCINAMY